MPVTIDDISRQLGLSVSTVSKALNDYNDVSDTTKQRVRDAAVASGYIPSAAARNLRRQRTEKIGFSYGYRTDAIGEYASRLINGAVSAVEKEGYNLTLYPFREDRLDQLVHIARAREIDGLLLMGGPSWRSTIERLKQQRMPLVVLVRRVDDPEISYVTSDDVYSGALITRHMIELGHQRIAFVTRTVLENSEDRISGYVQALAEANIVLDEQMIARTELAPGTAYQAVNRLLSLPSPPTAVIGLNDPVAIECQQAVLDRGLRVPDDVAIAGSDNIRDSMEANPPITTLHPPLAEIGRLAAEALLMQVVEPLRPATKIQLPAKLIVRQSTIG